MEMVNVELCEVPVIIDNYKTYELKELPKVILGFQIKNKFDEDRLQFKSGFSARRIIHFGRTIELEPLEPILFYGLEINVLPEYKELIHTLDTFNSVFMKYHKVGANFIEQYQNHLKQFGLSCVECYRYLKDGIFPIDLKYLPKLINNDKNLPINDLASMLEISPEQWYLNIGAFGIYVLGTCGIYHNNK